MAKRFSALLLCFMLLWIGAVSVCAAPPEEDKITIKEGYASVAENNAYRLYADLKTGDFALLDRLNQQIWYSGQWEVLDPDSPVSESNTGRIKTDLVSVVAVNYVQISTIASTAIPSYQNSYAYSVIKDNVTVKTIQNGIRTDYYFEDIDSTIPVEITLSEKGLTARIVGADLKIGTEYRVTAIDLLPGFMAADERHEGYLFVPSGSGGIIPLHSGKGDIASYSEMVYGKDGAIEVEEYTGESQNILVPVYGIKRGDSAAMAVITSGDTSASICAGANSSTTSFSYVYSEYTTAIVDSTTLFESNFENQRVIYGAEKRGKFEDFTVDYYFLSGASANYSGMAAIYRDYLNLKRNASPPAAALTLYGAATRKASFLGIPYTKTFALTSFSQAQDIIADLNSAGVPVVLKYVGWNNSGVENKKLPTKFAPVRVLGGKKGFAKLQASLKDSQNSFYFDLDFTTIKKSGRGFSSFSDVCRSIFNTRTPLYKYMRSVYVPVNTENPSYLLKSSKVVNAAEKFLAAYPYDGGISLDKLGEFLYSDFSKDGCTRKDTETTFTGLMQQMSEKHSLAVNKGNAYTFAYVDRINELPTSHDGNLLFSESVPFVQMVLHGSVSYSAQIGDSLLDCLEFGADPSFAGIAADDSTLIETPFNWLYGTTYESWQKQAKETYARYEEVYRTLYASKMTAHRSDHGLSVTEFDNGTKIYVNRGEQAATFEGVEIPAVGYKVIGGGAS